MTSSYGFYLLSLATGTFFLLLKPSFELSINLFILKFFSSASLKTLRFTKPTIVLDLPNRYHSTLSYLEILIFSCKRTLITFYSNCPSFTSTVTPCIPPSTLALLIWSFFKSNNLASRFYIFWSLIFFSLSAAIIESFIFNILSVTISFTMLAKFSLSSFNCKLILPNLLSILTLT